MERGRGKKREGGRWEGYINENEASLMTTRIQATKTFSGLGNIKCLPHFVPRKAFSSDLS